MVSEKLLKENMKKRGCIFYKNKFEAYRLSLENNVRFSITYYFNERLKDTSYYLHDFSREYRHSVVGKFYNRNLDLLLDICSWLNWREDNDK